MDTPAPTPAMEKVSFPTNDGVKIVGNYYDSTTTKAVLLLHQNGMDKSSWGDFPLALQARGFAVLAIDLRGYGESTQGTDASTSQPKTYDYKQFANHDYFPAMTWDVAAARKFLQSKGKTEQDIVGASIGANLAIVELALHTEPQDPRNLIGYNSHKGADNGETPFDPTKIDPLGKVKRIVILSPGLDFKGIQTELPAHNIKAEYEQEKDKPNMNSLYKFGPLPFVLLVSESGDSQSAAPAKKLQDVIGDPLALSLSLDGDAHGTNILTDKPQVRDAVINFLAR